MASVWNVILQAYLSDAIYATTATGILGREACYSGQEINWDKAMQSTTRLGPKEFKFGPYEVPDVARPSIYKFT